MSNDAHRSGEDIPSREGLRAVVCFPAQVLFHDRVGQLLIVAVEPAHRPPSAIADCCQCTPITMLAATAPSAFTSPSNPQLCFVLVKDKLSHPWGALGSV
eukprot:6189785-Pleurochrysis_carterae.AAC.1